MIGFVEYSTIQTKSLLHFNLIFQFQPGSTTNYGIYMPPSVPRKNSVPFSRFGYTLFYIKTWMCPAGLFFNTTTNLCESCPIPNCATCTNIDLCNACNTGFTLDATLLPSGQCKNCTLTGCLTCATSTSCSLCDTAKGYFLVAGGGGGGNKNVCKMCTIPNCITCSTSTACGTCDTANNYFINAASTTAAD